MPAQTARFLALLFVALVLSTSDDATAQQSPATAASKAATTRLNQARQILMNGSSLEAKIEQRGRLTTGPFQSVGTYQAGRFPMLRVETTTELNGLTGRMVQVCDGQVLWTQRSVSGLPIDPDDEESTGQEISVTRRDIDLIRDALANSPQSAANVLAAELGVGGLPSLLAGLEWAFDFREQTLDDQRILLVGRWKPNVREQLKLSGSSSRVPTEVEVVFPPRSPVPESITYFRRTKDSSREVLSLQFKDVLIGRDLPPSLFEYILPEGIDVDNQTLDIVKGIETANGESSPGK